jgi:transposase
MEATQLLSLPEGMLIEQLQITKTGLAITVIATHPVSCCPLCSQASSSLHSHYQRTLSDVPCGGRQVQLCLTVRRFYCRNALCKRKVFTERMPHFVEPWARMTIRLCEELQSIGLATCGKGGARLAARLGMHTSRNSILRRIMEVPDASPRSVVFLGIDDFSFRRGYRFGTILVNLESHRVVDLLPDRQAETASQWMRHQPDLAVVSRDRGGEYASGAREGAPQALQCADRFHVVKNLTEAFQVLLARCQAEIVAEKKPGEPCQDEQNKPIISIEEWRPPEPAHVQKVRLARRAGRYARYQHVVELDRQGLPTKEIARRVGLSDRTLRDWLKQGAFPEAQKRRKRQSSFDPFAAYVLKRWQEGERNGLALWREIKAQGYTGTERSI